MGDLQIKGSIARYDRNLVGIRVFGNLIGISYDGWYF